MKVIFSDRAYVALLAETQERITTETGGVFLGHYKDDTWYIVETCDPGPNSVFKVAYFEYDRPYVEHLARKVARLYHNIPKIVGLWHRHPGSFDVFSNVDDGTNSDFAKLNPEGAISILANIDPDFRLSVYHVTFPHKYTKIFYQVGNQLIPEEMLRLQEPNHFLGIMNGSYDSDKKETSSSLSSFIESILPQMEKINYSKYNEDSSLYRHDHRFDSASTQEQMQEKLIDEIVDDLIYMTDVLRIKTTVSSSEYGVLTVSQLELDNTTKLSFTFLPSELHSRCAFTYKKIDYSYRKKLFTEAAKKTNASANDADNSGIESQKEADNDSDDEIRKKKQLGIVSTVVKILKINRDGK